MGRLCLGIWQVPVLHLLFPRHPSTGCCTALWLNRWRMGAELVPKSQATPLLLDVPAPGTLALLKLLRPSCSETPAATPPSSAAVSLLMTVGTQSPLGPVLQVCGFVSLWCLKRGEDSILTVELNGIFKTKCCGLHTLVMLQWG